MAADTKDLSIKGESIQSLYGSFLSKQFLVNRRYQRKLVWSIEEKRAFIDSIIKGYPVPLVLLAEVTTDKGKQLEIIDGMQRMNAIMSFIEQEFDIEDKFFDLDTMADTKLLKDENVLKQKEPVIERSICADIVRYQIPLSVFQEAGTSHIDEVFRRLNSGGRHLSKQELRQAGVLSKFATMVRKLSSNIRGDASATDILDLNSMKNISITNKSLDYGISIEDIFWIKNNIMSKEDLRQSKDEEVIADIVAWVTFDKGIRSSSEILNQLYGYGVAVDSTSLSQTLEFQIQKINDEKIIYNIQLVFDRLIDLINSSGKTFNSLLFANQQAKIARYFQIVFLSFYQLLVDEDLEVGNRKALLALLDKAGDKIISLAAGGGNWSAKEKQTQIDALCGVIRGTFIKSTSNDPARGQWITRFENILMQSSTEQTLYDFKVGLHSLMGDDKFNQELFSKIIKTLTAMANTLKNSVGYCLIGVADNKRTSDKYEEVYDEPSVSYSNFFVTGVNKEAEKFHGDTDKYFTKITQLVANEPISARDKDNILRNISIVDYFNKTVIILKIESGTEPSVYNGKYFVRHGSNIDEVLPENFNTLFKRFQ